ncbi:MAG: hypothetical protein AB2L18_02365 [Anaerolineaceae bacterium]
MMKNQTNKTNWWIDLILFSGFVLAFLLDLTGLPLHQWGGLFICVLALYHLLRHWKWIVNILQRFYQRGVGSQRVRFLVDLILLFGFELILLTGLMISSWFNFSLTDYLLIRNVHVISSISCLVLLVLKIALHMRWIISTMRKILNRSAKQPSLTNTNISHPGNVKLIERREMLRMMGLVGSASLAALFFGGASTLQSLLSNESAVDNSTTQLNDPQVHTITQENTRIVGTPTISPSVNPTVTPTPQTLPTLSPTSVSVTSACVVRCPNACFYPGRCRRYVDTNGNNRCDLGECL